jgi:hypothetical protein
MPMRLRVKPVIGRGRREAARSRGVGELGMCRDPLADGAAGHAEAASQIEIGGAARAELAASAGVLGPVEGGRPGPDMADAPDEELDRI